MSRTSEQLDKLAPALLRAQKAMENVTFDSTNPHFKNKYAGLPGVLEEVKTKLNAEGIIILQLPTEAPDGHLGLTTRLQHEGGQFIEDTAIVPLPKQDPQGFGSAMTYTRRYAALSIVGLVGEADDDAQAASGPSRQSAPPREAPQRPAGAGIFGKPKAAASAPPVTAPAPAKKKGGLFPTPATGARKELDVAPPSNGGKADTETEAE